MEKVIRLLCGVTLLLPNSQQQQMINQPDIITFNQQSRSSPQSPPVPFTFPSQSTGSSFQLASPPLPSASFLASIQPQQSSAVDSSADASVSNTQGSAGIRGSSSLLLKNQGNSLTSQPAVHSNRFSIPSAMLSLALDMGRCKDIAENDCATNTVFSPLSIASTLTMLLMGRFS